MGFIKSIETSFSGQMEDQYREVIRSGGFGPQIVVKRVTTPNGVITDQSRLFLEPGEAVIFVDNGAIKDIISEPGMYFMDTSAPTLFQTNIFKGIGETFLQAIKRVAYQGDTITKQSVFYVNLTEQLNIPFGTESPILYKDPTWGPIEIMMRGSYAFKIVNPVNVLTDVLGNRDSLNTSDLEDTIRPYVVAAMNSEIANSNLSFDELATKQDEFGTKLTENITEKLEALGVEVTKVIISAFDVPEEVKKSMRERTAIKMKATSANDEEADIYTKLNKAEAIKDLANNPNSTGTTIMGMNMGNVFGGEMKDTLKDVDNK